MPSLFSSTAPAVLFRLKSTSHLHVQFKSLSWAPWFALVRLGRIEKAKEANTDALCFAAALSLQVRVG